MAHPHNQDIRIECLDKSACAQCGAVVDLTGKEAFAVVQCPRCQARFTAPGVLGNLALLKVLGKGQMGVTFKAHDRSLGRSVAVKVMRTTGAADRKAIDDFFSEARALGVLDHPNVAKIYSLVENAECPYIVMELLEGGSMEKQFDKGRAMDEVRALEIGMGVAKALSAASEVGLIHGDVKPGNIMLDEKGRAKLVDFGIARFGGGRTNELDALGTPYYASPEQVLRKSVDFRTDMYSLGATLFHALTGVPPFPGTVLKDVLAARLKAPAPDLRSVRADLHPKTAAAVARMLEADPDKRYASYDELRSALEDAYAEAAGLQAPLPETPAAGSSRWLLIGGALAAMVVAGVLIAYFLHGEPPPPPSVATTAPAPVNESALPLAARPTLSPPEQAVSQDIDVAISCDTSGATIRFTLDGGEPSEASQKYDKSVPIAPGTTIKARAFAPGYRPSGVAAATYALDTSALKDIVPLRASANDAWNKVKTLDGGQGFKAPLDAARILHDTAEELYQKNAYGPAGKAYGELTAACNTIKTRQDARLKAQRAQEKGRELAGVLAGLPKDGQSWTDVAAEQKEADSLFEAGRFEEALARWGKADLKARTLLQDAAKDAQKLYRDRAAKVDMATITAFGGKSYQDLQAAVDKAEKALAAGDFLAATTNYQLACKALPAAAVAGKLRQGARTLQDKVALALKQAKDMQLADADNTIEEILKLDPYQSDAWTLRNQWSARETASLPLDGNPASATALKVVLIRPGTFVMGPPVHLLKVTLTKSFYLGQYELTKGQFELFVKARQSTDKTFKTQAEHDAETAAAKKPAPKKPLPTWNSPGCTQDGSYPVTCLTWKEAEEFCAWASDKTGATFRLPTEAEWEYACRAGTTTPFSFVPPTDLPQYGNYADKRLNPAGFGDDGSVNTAPVGKYKPNPWKLFDMHGNVAEWCSDWFTDTPMGEKDPVGPSSGSKRVARGGSWTAKPQDCASYSRIGVAPTTTYPDLGFRVAASTVPEKAFTPMPFTVLPAAPPTPDVQASEQTPLPGSSDFASNLSFTHAPLKIGSVDYQMGLGAGSPSNLILAVKPAFKRFVGIAGLDENQRAARPNSALRCRVYFDDVEVASTPILRYAVGASSWPFDVKIPDGVRLIRLVVEEVTLGTTKGDGHINWVNVGFCTEGH
ncbi:MAG: SUMF1/EgtB/PvdO family nonheme iron enzyme [Planctomycetota bacterium]|nr:SUMF1/EgtB/PvdO family nonheme iron enzyme [Planctomycetota bacterium]